jgi:methylenetetrahydrofolate dehydrogenase (NADP+)/methenyltetrahydrofolate cyclohydrolase
MSAVIFDGKAFAAEREEALKLKVVELKHQGLLPKLVWISVGNAEQNELYGRIKAQAAERVGVEFEGVSVKVEKQKSRKARHVVDEVRELIGDFNRDEGVHGVMVQLPMELELGIRNQESGLLQLDILSSIAPEKDVDCLTPENLGRVVAGEPRYLPATVRAVVWILHEALKVGEGQRFIKEIEETPPSLPLTGEELIKGKRVVVVGGGLEVGRPLVSLLSNLGATVLWARSSERDLGKITRQGEVVISAVGKRGLISGDMVQEGVVAIDVGSPDGDLEFESVKEKASFITPVPGGVGPVTVVNLLENVVGSAKRR